MLGIAILFVFYFIGIVFQQVLGLPLPAGVTGMILFTISLFCRIVKLEWVEEAGQFLIRHMVLLYVPIVVGTMVFFHVIAQQALVILVSLFVSTLGVLLITGLSSKWAGGAARKEEEHKHDVS